MILNKLFLLIEIINERLPDIKRWEKCGIYFHGDRLPRDTISDLDLRPGYFYLLWYSSRRSNSSNTAEFKEIPLNIDDLDAVIKRQRQKLATESENA